MKTKFLLTAIAGYPTLLLREADGRPYAATGFQEG
jgi:hypothetical protein